MTNSVVHGALRLEGLDVAWQQWAPTEDAFNNLYDALQEVRFTLASDPNADYCRGRLLADLASFLGHALTIANALYAHPEFRVADLRAQSTRLIERDALASARAFKGPIW